MAERARGDRVRWAGPILALVMLFGCAGDDGQEPIDDPGSATTPSVVTTAATTPGPQNHPPP